MFTRLSLRLDRIFENPTIQQLKGIFAAVKRAHPTNVGLLYLRYVLYEGNTYYADAWDYEHSQIALEAGVPNYGKNKGYLFERDLTNLKNQSQLRQLEITRLSDLNLDWSKE
jgi:hypothetical protein